VAWHSAVHTYYFSNSRRKKADSGALQMASHHGFRHLAASNVSRCYGVRPVQWLFYPLDARKGEEFMKRRSFKTVYIMIIALLMLAAVSGCGAAPNDNPPSAPDGNTVIIENHEFQPAEITIQSGETVTWINKDSVKHTITADSFDSGLIGKDESFQQTFDEAGTFEYTCNPHPYMKGKVIVE
jgi:plastocyanin